MIGNLILAAIAVAVTAPLAWVAFRNVRTGRYPRQKTGGPGLPPPSGPDIGGGITGV